MPGGSWRRSFGTVVVVCSMTAVAGCAGTAESTGTTAGTGQPAPTAAPAPIAWSPCPAGEPAQCGTVTVPVDYANPTAGSIPLAVTKLPRADGATAGGTLVVNPGGPGESGNQIVPLLAGRLPAGIRESFDIVSFDPRGTGASDPLDCGTPPAAASSALPVPAGTDVALPGAPVYAAMDLACHERAPVTPYVDTVDTARDMDRIRQAIGEPKLDYYGLSYGTVLGAVYADLFPERVGTFVLDGAVDVGATLATQADEEAPAAERSLDHLLASCAASPPCPLGTDPRASYRALETSLADRPLPAPGQGDPYPVTVGDLDTAALLTVSVTGFTAAFYSALTSAEGGDGAPLRALALQLEEDVDGAPLVDPLWAITCNDTAVHPGPVAAGRQAKALAAKYPLLGGYAVEYTMGGCVRWPPGRWPVTGIHPHGLPPILVIGNTGDPNTPIAGATHLAALIPGAHLLTWNGWGHTWLLSGPDDTCMQRLVSRYLTGGGAPPPDDRCS